MDLKNLVITDQRLGKGNFGSVFVCQLGKKKVAAKKLLQPGKQFNILIREASRLKRLQYGKHIAYTHGIALKDESLYLVMEYCERGDLQNYLKGNKESVTYEQKIFFCHGILLGLLYCHSMKIFHGDIKCSNVILSKNLEPKLTDFGLGITVDNIAYYSNLYKGSLYWAAPELFSIKDVETIYQEFIADPYPCDVYSLGATFCEISYDGTTEFISSDDPGLDVMLEIVSPTPKDAFLEEIVTKCCQFDRNERILLDECLLELGNVAEEQLLVPTIDNKWQEIKQDIQTNSKLELPPSFILFRPAENLVVGPSNLSLLEWLCISDNLKAVEYMVQLHNPEQKRLEWLYSISALCKSPNTAEFLQSTLQNSTTTSLKLSSLIDISPWQLIETFVKAGANCDEDELLNKAVKGHHNKIVQLYMDSAPFYSRTVIHDAIKSENTETVRVLAGRIDFEYRDENGDTPLLTAISTGNFEIVKILLDRKVNVHSKNNYSQHTSLYRAAAKGNREIVELLINAGAAIDIQSNEWNSLVQDLRQRGKSSIMQFISNVMRNRANAAGKPHSTVIPTKSNETDKSAKATFLCAAIQVGQSDLVQSLIDDGADANEHGYDKYSPLHWAVIIGNENIARILLKAGADIDAKTPNQEQNFYTPSSSDYFNGYTPLHIAIAKRHLGIAKFLIKPGANFSLKNEAGQTIMEMVDSDDKKRIESIIQECAPVTEDSFQWILEAMSIKTVKTLISSGNASMNTLNHFLCIAAHHGNTEAIDYLLKHGTNVNSEYKGKSPLQWAISGDHVQTVQTLIDQGTEIYSKRNRKHNLKGIIKVLKKFFSGKKSKANEVQNSSNPPLHQAATLNNVEIVEILLNAGVDIDARDNGGYNALYCAALCGCSEAVALLHERGAKVKLWKKKDDSDAIYKTAKRIVHKAAETGKANTEKIFTDAGVRVNSENKSNYIPPLAVMPNKNEMMADSSLSSNTLFDENLDKITALFEAVKSNQLEKVRLLFDDGIDINAKNTDGMTPLFECVDKSLVDMVQFLVEKKADVNARDKDGFSPIHYAKDKQIAEILIACGADINAKNISGKTSSFENARESLVDMVQFLTEKKADVNARNERGYAPIHFVRDKQIAEILIAYGADINTKSTSGRTLLFECVEESLVDMVQFLIEKGADINDRTKDGYTPIHFVRDKQIAEILIVCGSDVNAKSISGITPLFQCVDKSLLDVVQLLINKGADVNARSERGYAPIHFAKDKKTAEILIANGSDINSKSISGTTPLFEYVKESLVDMVQFLIEKRADVNARDEHGFTPIHFVRDKQIAEILIANGTDINAKSANDKTPLFECVKESLVNIVQLLIENGADINARDEHGFTPIHFVKDRKIAEILIACGADINAKSANGKTPLIECIDESLIDVVRFMIEKGANVDARAQHGYAPIHYARNKQIAEILIAYGADINTKNASGRTTLLECVEESLVDMVQFLIEKGADINARTKDGYTPIHFVRDKQIAEILIVCGSDVNAKSISGITPLFQCVNKSLIDVVQLLINKGADVNARNLHGYVPIHCVRNKQIAEILISHCADIDAKSNHGKTLLGILLEEQNKNLGNILYKTKEVSELLEYLKNLK